ncbi:MAG: hypothetical protein WC451_05235 [Patescibacteria group bacterium]|jgi:hypothetical protein
MKKAVMFASALLISAGLIFAADFSPSKRSTDLSKNPATSGRVLKTDGTYNYWASPDITVTEETTLGMTNATVAITPAVMTNATATGANNLVVITNYYNPVNQTVSLTDTNGVTALVLTNVTWSTIVYGFATNNVVAVTITRQTVTPTATVTKQTATIVTNVTATNP